MHSVEMLQMRNGGKLNRFSYSCKMCIWWCSASHVFFLLFNSSRRFDLASLSAFIGVDPEIVTERLDHALKFPTLRPLALDVDARNHPYVRDGQHLSLMDDNNVPRMISVSGSMRHMMNDVIYGVLIDYDASDCPFIPRSVDVRWCSNHSCFDQRGTAWISLRNPA